MSENSDYFPQLEPDLQAFYQFLQSEKHFSPHTLKAYRRDIELFLGYCHSAIESAIKEQASTDFSVTRTAKLQWASIDELHIRQFVSQVHRRGLGGKSIQRCLSSLRRLFHFLQVNHQLKLNPAAHVQAPKSASKLPEVMHPQQLDALLDYKGDEPLMLRDFAILELLYASGLRLSELISLNMADINWQNSSVIVLGKGRKERHCPFGKQAAKMLKKWLKCRENLVKESEKAVFINNRGGRISASGIRARMKKLCQQKGVSQRVYPHLMRHSFASHMLEASQDLRAVQELLGHAHLKTTQIYTHLDFQQLAKTYDAAHPRAIKRAIKGATKGVIKKGD